MKLIVIDNYDSFTYNLVHYFEDLGCDVTVKRNDEVEMSEIEKFEYFEILSMITWGLWALRKSPNENNGEMALKQAINLTQNKKL